MKPHFLLILFALSIHIFGLGQSPSLEWAKGIGGPQWEENDAMTVDPAGNVYTAGIFSGTVDFDPGPGMYNLYGGGMFVSKLDAAGNFLWAKRINGSGVRCGYSIGVDKLGNICVSGVFQNTIYFDSISGLHSLTSVGDNDAFICKLDYAGNFIWAKQFGGHSNDGFPYITNDVAGNVYATGNFTDTIDFDPGANTYNLIAAPGVTDVFITKLDSAGNLLWVKQTSGTALKISAAIVADSLGNVYTAGTFFDTVDFDPGGGIFNLYYSQGAHGYVLKLDSSGNFIWATRVNGDFCTFLALDDQDNVYSGEHDKLVKLNASGNVVWFKQWFWVYNTTSISVRSIAVDKQGNIYATGTFSKTIDFDLNSGVYNLTGNGGDAFVAKYDSSGSLIYAVSMGANSPDAQSAHMIALDSAANVYIAGSFRGTADFDPNTGVYNLTSAGEWDEFLVKFTRSTLPLRLLNFAVQSNNNQHVKLQWKTAQEQNTAQFIIERNANRGDFTFIGTVNAAGNSTMVKEYLFTDKEPLKGTNYYRLKMMDKDGSFSYSRIEKVSLSKFNFLLSVYPNPAKDKLYVQAFGASETAILQIIDATGKIVKIQIVQLNGNPFTVDISKLASGKYFLMLYKKGVKESTEFIKP